MVRFKNRYLTIEINPEDVQNEHFKLKESLLHKAIVSSVEMIHGDFGVASIRTGFAAKYCNEITRVAIIRVRHGPHQLVSSVLPFINSIGKYRVSIRTIYVGATIQNCYKRIIKHQKSELVKMMKNLKNTSVRPELEKQVLEMKDVFNSKKLNPF